SCSCERRAPAAETTKQADVISSCSCSYRSPALSICSRLPVFSRTLSSPAEALKRIPPSPPGLFLLLHSRRTASAPRTIELEDAAGRGPRAFSSPPARNSFLHPFLDSPPLP